jgi:hypothetical protein
MAGSTNALIEYIRFQKTMMNMLTLFSIAAIFLMACASCQQAPQLKIKQVVGRKALMSAPIAASSSQPSLQQAHAPPVAAQHRSTANSLLHYLAHSVLHLQSGAVTAGDTRPAAKHSGLQHINSMSGGAGSTSARPSTAAELQYMLQPLCTNHDMAAAALAAGDFSSLPPCTMPAAASVPSLSFTAH